MSTVVLSDSKVIQDLKTSIANSVSGVANTVYITQASDLSNYDDTKVYFADGLIDMTGVPIEVGNKGFTCYSDDYNKKGLYTTDTSGSLFVNAPNDYAGDINLSKMKVASTPSCGVFNLDNQGNSNEIKLEEVNFGFFGATKTNMGTLANFRQWLSNNVGMFNLHDGLILEGDWTGFKITNLIGILLGDETLFQAGAGFNTDDFRFISNKIVNVGDGFSLADFSPSNINNPEGLQIKLNEFKAIDMLPNAPRTDAKSLFVSNSGIQNTHVGGKARVSSTATTTISSTGVAVKVAGTTSYQDLQHFTGGVLADGAGTNVDNSLTYVGGGALKEFKVRAEATIDGGANDEIELFLRHWDDSASAYVDIDSRARNISNVLGGLDVAYFNFEDTVTLDTNDRVELWGANNDDTSNFVALADTTITVEER